LAQVLDTDNHLSRQWITSKGKPPLPTLYQRHNLHYIKLVLVLVPYVHYVCMDRAAEHFLPLRRQWRRLACIT